jgi:hypothetical protein
MFNYLYFDHNIKTYTLVLPYFMHLISIPDKIAESMTGYCLLAYF